MFLSLNMNTKTEPLALTIDFGTQSVRVSIFNRQGEILAIKKQVYHPTYESSKPGYAEHNASFYWDNLKQVTLTLQKDHPDLLKQVTTAAMTAFRGTAIMLDQDKKPVRKVILWLDQRLAKFEPFSLFHNIAYHFLGLYQTAKLNSRRTMARWVRQNEPETWKRVRYYVALSTYFNYLLTDQLTDSAANMIGHYPLDFITSKWYKPTHIKAAIFNIPLSMLVPLKKPGDLLGRITKKASAELGLPEGLPIYAAGPDKAAETLGTGCLTNDTANLSYGTSVSMTVPSKVYVEPEPFLPGYPSSLPNLYNIEVHINRGYWMISWFRDNFAHKETAEAMIDQMAVEEKLNQQMMKIPPGSEGLVLSPYWGPGLRRPEAKGAIVGWSDVHTKVHLYRAIVEGIAFGIQEGFLGMQKRLKHKVKEIRVSGGGSKSDAICQITADIFNLPVSRVQTNETSSLGTAIAAFLASGDFTSAEEAVASMVRVSKTFNPNPEAVKRYQYLYHKVYAKIYPKLLNLYRDLIKFNQ
jgi:sugar (pentulose or hexulose) kinase